MSTGRGLTYPGGTRHGLQRGRPVTQHTVREDMMGSRATDLLDVVDAAYKVDLPDAEWLRELARAGAAARGCAEVEPEPACLSPPCKHLSRSRCDECVHCTAAGTASRRTATRRPRAKLAPWIALERPDVVIGQRPGLPQDVAVQRLDVPDGDLLPPCLV
jgi:hypothetical protein